MIATIHAKSCHQAIERLVTLAQPLARNAYDVVAGGIQAADLPGWRAMVPRAA
ncbi:hypothetical protein P4055_00055 [Pseudomonas aeruginosa]|nr:hypothetical protein [Pseudomonas aeruginosa]